MVLHARVLDVVLKGGLQLRQLLLCLGIDVFSPSVIRHLDVLQAVLRSNLLVFGCKSHAGTLGSGHLDRWKPRGSLESQALAVLLQLRESYHLVVSSSLQN